MSDTGIKKAKVLEGSLPDIVSTVEGYLIRYRVVSEDKNRTSHWSPIILIQPGYDYISGTTSITKAADHVVLIWDPVSIEKDGNYIRKAHEYDIWLQWDKSDGGDWVYGERIDSNTATFIIPDTYFINGVDQLSKPNNLTVEIFLKGQPITRDATFLKVYTIGPETV